MDYITIIQGDDTNFLGDQFVVVNFNTEIDLSGFTATFTLGDVTLTYGDLSGKSFEIILSSEITSNLKIGKQYGELKLIDRSQRIRTVTSIIPFIVKKGVNEDITVVKNSLTISMNINNTTIDINIETAGISRTETVRVMEYCNNAKQNAQNYANMAQNTLIQINRDVDNFYVNMNELNVSVNRAKETCENNITELETIAEQKIELATQQANIATQKTQEVTNTYNTAITDIATKKNESIVAIEDKTEASIDEVENSTLEGQNILQEIANENLYRLQMFDMVQKDHILDFEESRGLALLGTYVYKEPIMGSRYGYPDFYNKCLQEKEEATATTTTLGSGTLTTYVNANGHIFYDISDITIVDAFYNSNGACWMYGIDTENERIFLPRNDYIDYYGNTSNVGSYIQAGLPNITGSMYATSGDDMMTKHGVTTSGAFGAVGGWNSHNGTNSNGQSVIKGFDFYASRCSAIYGRSSTVQMNGVKKLFYMVVGNTTQEKSTVTEGKIIHTNNSIPLFYSYYSNVQFDSYCWLYSNGQVNDGKIYKTVFAELVNALNGINPRNLQVINVDSMVSGTDYSMYWKVNTTSETFIMPTKTGSAEDDKGLFLYFKVADTIQNANLLEGEEVLNNLVEITTRPYIIETYSNGSSWYRIWSDGWCEQGSSGYNESESTQHHLLLPYRDTNYTLLCLSHTGTWQAMISVGTKTASYFTLWTSDDSSFNPETFNWYACGYLE